MKNKILTTIFYGLIGIISSLALFLVFYWSLRLNSSIYNLVNLTKSQPLYLIPYIILTLGTVVLFGIDIPLLIYRWRKYGRPTLKNQAGTWFGSIVGIAASACPICGSLILSAIGIAGGLAAFPLQGLELKALSFGLMALPVILTTRQLRRFECKEETCPTPKDPSLKKKEVSILFVLLVIVVGLFSLGWKMLKEEPYFFAPATNPKSGNNPLYDEIVVKVLPKGGFQSKVYLGDSIVKLVENGVIDKKKFADIYNQRGGLPEELADILEKPSAKPILLTRDNSTIYVNLLWPIGLSNYTSANRLSPVNGKSLFNFASTGGWNIGKDQNGGTYFNKFKIVTLTAEQEALVTKIAKNTYRPCCDNSTFFQDCNHGSALLGLLELGASQRLTEGELYKEALHFNSFWFPNNYIQTALYFKIVKNTYWENVDAKEVMGYNYSAISQWNKNVQAEIAKIPNLLPQTNGGAGCGV